MVYTIYLVFAILYIAYLYIILLLSVSCRAGRYIEFVRYIAKLFISDTVRSNTIDINIQ